MNTHKNARLTYLRRLELVQDITEHGFSASEAAALQGVSAVTARKWHSRYLAGGADALLDKSSRPARSRELQPIQARKQVEVAIKAPAADVVAHVDPSQLQQVVRNVLANAIRFSDDGGVVEALIGERNDDTFEIRIRDHGPGGPSDEAESIFEPFVQSSRTKPSGDTTGLGLTICRKIMAAHGGNIYASNADGGGAEFHIVLPRVVEHSAPLATSCATPYQRWRSHGNSRTAHIS